MARRSRRTPQSTPPPATAASPASLLAPGEEKHLANVRQLTFGGQNAEAYWSADGKRLIFQSDEGNLPCDQIFTMNADGSDRRRVSNGEGKTTCAYFFPSGDRILYASTFRSGARLPAPARSLARATSGPSTTTTSTSARRRRQRHPAPLRLGLLRRGGDHLSGRKEDRLHLRAGRRPRRLRHGRRRLEREAAHEHARLRRRPLLFGRRHEDRLPRGSPDEPGGPREISREPGAPHLRSAGARDPGHERRRLATTTPSRPTAPRNFAPYFLPGGKEIIFSSNLADPKGRDFDLYTIREDGSGLTRITFSPDFDGFPMFTRDGKRLVFASNRNGKQPHETNIFVADWLGD